MGSTIYKYLVSMKMSKMCIAYYLSVIFRYMHKNVVLFFSKKKIIQSYYVHIF